MISINSVDTGCKLNVHKTFRRRPGRLLNVLCTFNLRPVSTGKWFCRCFSFFWIYIFIFVMGLCYVVQKVRFLFDSDAAERTGVMTNFSCWTCGCIWSFFARKTDKWFVEYAVFLIKMSLISIPFKLVMRRKWFFIAQTAMEMWYFQATDGSITWY